VIGEETFSKTKELLRGRLDRNQKKWMINTNIMECHALWITDMGYQKRRYRKKCEYGAEYKKSAGLNIITH